MRIFSTQDFDTLLAQLPNTPENNGAYQLLMQYRADSQVVKNPYTFDVDFSSGAGLLAGAFAAPAPNAQTVGNFLVDSSSPFMLVSTSYRADVAGAAANGGAYIEPNATVLIQDQSSNRNFMNIAVPVTSLFGRLGLPYFWPQPKLIPANTNIQVTLANYDAAVTNNVRLSFHGYRLYSLQS